MSLTDRLDLIKMFLHMRKNGREDLSQIHLVSSPSLIENPLFPSPWSIGQLGQKELLPYVNEAKIAYAAMRGAWPGEMWIKALRDDFLH